MKKIVFILCAAVLLAATFFAGRMSVNTSKILMNQADGLLAFEHYYEAAEAALDSVKITNAVIRTDLNTAREQLRNYCTGTVMVWPEICDQRDKLSDAIRCYYDNHPQFVGNEDDDIFMYVAEFGISPNKLISWAYAY